MRVLILALVLLQGASMPPVLTSTPASLQQVRVEWPLGSPNLYAEWVQKDVKSEITQRLVYRFYVDGLNGTMFRGMTCTQVGTDISCYAPLSIKAAPGKHTITFTVAEFVSGHSIEYPSQTGPESFPTESVAFEMK